MKKAVFQFLFSVFCFLLLGCETAVSVPTPILTPVETQDFASLPTPPIVETQDFASLPTPPIVQTQDFASLPTPTIAETQDIASLPPDTGWQTLQSGLERRTIRLFDGEGQQMEQLYLLRLDPTLFAFEIAYSPEQPKSLSTWQAETDALLVVNGGFFTEAYVATGLIVVDGVTSGVSYGDFAGMFAVTDDGPEVRWLTERPYAANEPLQFALQSFPMLVKPGGQLGFADEDGERARRTVVAQDGNGRMLFILAPFGSFTLHEMSRFLVKSDLEIDVALNLDGGTSTGLVLAHPEESVMAFTAVPVVIVVYPRP